MPYLIDSALIMICAPFFDANFFPCWSAISTAEVTIKKLIALIAIFMTVEESVNDNEDCFFRFLKTAVDINDLFCFFHINMSHAILFKTRYSCRAKVAVIKHHIEQELSVLSMHKLE